MRSVDLYTDLRCVQCGKTARVKNMVVKSARIHRCPKLRGLLTPMHREDVKARITIHEREDYVAGRERELQVDPELGRPIMNLETEYSDGHTDLVVFAPTARASIGR